MNWSEEKGIRLIEKSHVIEITVIISPNRFVSIFSIINKIVVNILAMSTESSWTTLS